MVNFRRALQPDLSGRDFSIRPKTHTKVAFKERKKQMSTYLQQYQLQYSLDHSRELFRHALTPADKLCEHQSSTYQSLYVTKLLRHVKQRQKYNVRSTKHDSKINPQDNIINIVFPKKRPLQLSSVPPTILTNLNKNVRNCCYPVFGLYSCRNVIYTHPLTYTTYCKHEK